MNTIDQWESEAQQNMEKAMNDERDERILALIDLVRKKDEAFKKMIDSWKNNIDLFDLFLKNLSHSRTS